MTNQMLSPPRPDRVRRWVLVGVLAALGIIVVAAFLSFRSPVLSSASRESGSSPGDTGISARVTIQSTSGSGAQASPDTGPEGQLVAAALASDAERVRELLTDGVTANANSGGMSALHRAAQANAVDVLALLLEAGADTTVVDPSGGTPLGRAAFFGRPEATLLLLRAGADPNAYANPNNMTPLTAVVFGWMLASSGQTPPGMELAVDAEERLGVVRSLLDAGADPGIAPGTVSALMLASSIGNADLTALLGRNDGSDDPG